MSPEQEDLYVLDQGTLTAIIIVAVIGSLVGSTLIFAALFTAEGKRIRHEKLTSKANRLRYRSNDEEVAAPSIPVDGYHLFLSHVWGTGQERGTIEFEYLHSATDPRSSPRHSS